MLSTTSQKEKEEKKTMILLPYVALYYAVIGFESIPTHSKMSGCHGFGSYSNSIVSPTQDGVP